MIKVCLVLQETAKLSFRDSTVLHPHQAPAFGAVRVLGFGHFTTRVVVLHCCFNLHFLNDVWHRAYFYILIWRFAYFLQWVVSCPFLMWFFIFLLLHFEFSCVFWWTVLYQITSFANSFSQTLVCLLILLTVSSAEQNAFSLTRLSLWILSFIAVPNSSPYPRSPRFPAMASPGNFIILHFTFRSMIHFELNFCEGHMVCARYTFCMCMSSCSRTTCWKDCLFSIVSPLLLCQRSADYIYVGLLLGSLSHSIDPFICSFANTMLSQLL